MDTIKIKNSNNVLNNLSFYSYHGVAPQERIVGNEFTISLKLKVDISKPAHTDDLNNTVSYADVYEIVKKQMAIPSKLLEHAAMNIVKMLFEEFELIEEINITLLKRNPPMGSDIDSAGVELHCTR